MSPRDNGRSPRHVLGGMVRFYRERAGVSRADLGRQICKSVSLIQAIELGSRTATPEVTADIETALDLGGALAELREQMSEGLSTQVFPAWFADWPGKEAAASALRWFEPLIVPGLLQTEDYARAIFRTRLNLTGDEIEELVAARMRRQEVLTRENPPMLWAVIDEGVLRRQVGSRQVMFGQVTRLVEAAKRPRVVVQVVPLSVGAYLGLLGAFVIADFELDPSVGYQEMVVGAQPLEQPDHIAALDLTWNTLRSEALPRAASLALLEEAAKSWSHAD